MAAWLHSNARAACGQATRCCSHTRHKPLSIPSPLHPPAVSHAMARNGTCASRLHRSASSHRYRSEEQEHAAPLAPLRETPQRADASHSPLGLFRHATRQRSPSPSPTPAAACRSHDGALRATVRWPVTNGLSVLPRLLAIDSRQRYDLAHSRMRRAGFAESRPLLVDSRWLLSTWAPGHQAAAAACQRSTSCRRRRRSIRHRAPGGGRQARQ